MTAVVRPPSDVAVVHPATGELIDRLDQRPPAQLADALMAVRERKRELAAAERLLADELRRMVLARTGGIGRAAVFGDFEVSVKGRRSSWDGEELEAVIKDLIDERVIDLRMWSDVVHRETTYKVDARRAKSLAATLQIGSSARARVEATCTWTYSDNVSSVEVVPSKPLIPELQSQAEQAATGDVEAA